MKTTILAIALAALPAFAWAACGHDRTAQSCADGASWDDEKGACVPIVTG